MTPEALRTLADTASGPGRSSRAIIEILPIAVYFTDAEGRISDFNSAAVKLSGRTPELGVDRWCVVSELFLPDGTPQPLGECSMAIALNGGEVVEGTEYIAERPDGTRFWFMSYPAVLQDPEGKITGGLNMLVDITHRKLAESEMQRGSLLLSAIVDSSDDAIISKNLNGTITSWNKSAERVFGYTAGEIVGKPITLLIPPDRLDEEPQIIARLKKGERVDHFETVRRRKDGTLLDISLTISPVRDADGRIAGASKIARDISERKRAEAEIRRVNRDLEQFAFSASHDLQEPLRSIKIYSELLTRRYAEKFDGQALEFLGYLRTGATRMESLVADLLAYAQVSRDEEQQENVDANATLTTVLESLSGAIGESKAHVTSELLPELRMHRGHLQSLLQNLIGNAIKYRRRELTPSIHVAAELQGTEWIFSISDNGIGIAPQYRENIFGLFQRLHTGEEYSGTGIGLALCQRIVGLYHGRIWVDSELGRGSIFRFTIPALATGNR